MAFEALRERLGAAERRLEKWYQAPCTGDALSRMHTYREVWVMLQSVRLGLAFCELESPDGGGQCQQQDPLVRYLRRTAQTNESLEPALSEGLNRIDARLDELESDSVHAEVHHE